MGTQLTWRDPGCTVPSNGTHMVSTIRHNQCGTTVKITKSHVEFKNELIARSSNHTHSLIDFGDDSYVIPVTCIYPRQGQAMTSYLPTQQRVRFYEKRSGYFDVSITQFSDDKFNSAVQDLSVPRMVAMKSDIYLQVEMSSDGLGIHVDKCIATPTISPSDPVFYPLISDGCPANQNVNILPSGNISKVHLGVRAFQFSANASSVVYIHCQVSACDPGQPNCAANCVSPGRRRRAAEEKAHLVSAGPFKLLTDDKGVSLQSSTIVAIMCGSVAVVACVVAIAGWIRRRPIKSHEVNYTSM